MICFSSGAFASAILAGIDVFSELSWLFIFEIFSFKTFSAAATFAGIEFLASISSFLRETIFSSRGFLASLIFPAMEAL